MTKTKPHVTVIAEDELSFQFFRRLLVSLGCTISQRVRGVIAPSGLGSAKEWVAGAAKGEFRMLPRQRARRMQLLAILTDGDNEAVEAVESRFATVVDKPGHSAERLIIDHGVLLLIPRWSVETWILHLSGKEAAREDVKTTSAQKRIALEKYAYAADELGRRIVAHESEFRSAPDSMVRAANLIRLMSKEVSRVKST